MARSADRTPPGSRAFALSSLYLQTLSMLLVPAGVHVAWHPVAIDDPAGAMAMFLLAVFTGLGVGMVFLALRPWAPNLAQVANQLYSRANMIASGQMFLGNALPASALAFFEWNPLFHAIDHARGAAFVNYEPHHGGWGYALAVGAALLVVWTMAEFRTRRRASLSWFAAR